MEMINSDRSAFITLGGQEYELMLTTLATKSIARRYGGLENLGEKLAGSEHFEDALDEIVWLITLLANQSILIYNLWNETNKHGAVKKQLQESRDSLKAVSLGF